MKKNTNKNSIHENKEFTTLTEIQGIHKIATQQQNIRAKLISIPEQTLIPLDEFFVIPLTPAHS